MSLTSARPIDPAGKATLDFLRQMLGGYHPRDFAVRLWDGTVWPAEEGQTPRFALVLRHPGALRRMLWPPGDLAFGEAYLYGDVDVEGDLRGIFDLSDYLRQSRLGPAGRARMAWQLFRLPSGGPPRPPRLAANLEGARHSVERDRQAISYSYDATYDLYTQLLGKERVYSGAYFQTPDDDLDQAQEQKLDYVCRKLHLRQGERLLDLGCGSGALVIHAARHYGVSALGITNSQRQAVAASERIAREGLADRCRVEERDYRGLDRDVLYDKLVSIEMIGHVGRENLPGLFHQAHELLRPGGLFLVQAIARRADEKPPRRGSFADHYVFPDSEAFPIDFTFRLAEESGFEIRDLENVREHYALTMKRWLERLDQLPPAAPGSPDDVNRRVARLSISAFIHGFEKSGVIWLYHALLAKRDRGAVDLPLARTRTENG